VSTKNAFRSVGVASQHANVMAISHEVSHDKSAQTTAPAGNQHFGRHVEEP
jgi:hypothetical protein